jgi:hypothetical protein
MELINEYTVTGTIKNIRTFTGSRGTLVTGWLNQRDMSRLSDGTADRPVYVVGMNIVGLDGDVVTDLVELDKARQGQEETMLVTLKGRMITKFDRRPQVAESERRVPQLQFEVFEVHTN